jgi:tetratricopeptide (TPR) repeat protein
MWQSTAVTVLALAAVGVAGARLAAPRPRVRVWLRVLMVVAAVVAGAVQIPGLISTTDLRHSQAAERAGNPSVALGWANDAVSAEPWSASAYQQRGLVYEAAGLFQPAAADLQRAVNHEPTNYIHWLLLARIRAEAGQISAASADLATARRLRPKASVFSLAPYFAAPGKPNGILP